MDRWRTRIPPRRSAAGSAGPGQSCSGTHCVAAAGGEHGSRCNMTLCDTPFGITSDCACFPDCPGQTDRSASGSDCGTWPFGRSRDVVGGGRRKRGSRGSSTRPSSWYYTGPSSCSPSQGGAVRKFPSSWAEEQEIGFSTASQLSPEFGSRLANMGARIKYMQCLGRRWPLPMGQGVRAREIWVVMRAPSWERGREDAGQRAQWKRVCGFLQLVWAVSASSLSVERSTRCAPFRMASSERVEAVGSAAGVGKLGASSQRQQQQ